jgi:chromate transport protein ChrA
MNFPDPLSPQYKAGVLLINTGSPDTPDAASVRRYLAEFLSDERVIELPKWKWWPILHGLKLLALIVVADAVLTMSRQFCATPLTQGIMVATAAALWWQPGLLTQLLMLAGAALICARNQQGVSRLHATAEPSSATTRHPHWPTLLLFAALFIGLPLLGGPLGPLGTLGQLIADFYRAGSLVFGGGHVVLPLLQESVGHTLSQQQFLTGYSLAQLVPLALQEHGIDAELWGAIAIAQLQAVLDTDLDGQGLRLSALREFSHLTSPENEVMLQLKWYHY